MHVVCPQDQLRRAITVVSRAVPSRTVLPSLGHVLLEASGGRLRLTATNLEIGITRWVDADVRKEGAVTVPSKLLNDIVGSLPSAPITMTLDARTHIVHLTCAHFEIRLNGAEAAIFPHPPRIDSDSSVVHLPASMLRESITQVAYAASTDDIRPVLQGVHLRFHAANVMLRAADGFRMAQQTITLPEPVEPERSVLIPARALAELARILDDDATVALLMPSGGEHVVFDAGDTLLSSRVIHGTFPDVDKVIPSHYRTRAIIERDALSKAVKLASFFADASSHVALLHIVPADAPGAGQIVVSANAAEVGDNTGWVEATIQGDETRIALNVRLLADAIAAIASQHVVLDIQSPNAPVVLRPDEQSTTMHLIMPMVIHSSHTLHHETSS